MEKGKPKEIFTIGHSTRSIDSFLDMLKSHEIKTIADIRTIPKSRANPQYNQEALESALKGSHIHYRYLEKLGGLRHAKKDSINIGWHNSSFRGFADYMQTDPFWEGIKQLEEIAVKSRTAIMCAEAVPWRCHRSLVADALTSRGWQVYHITSKQPAKEHTYTSFLQIDKEGNLSYP